MPALCTTSFPLSPSRLTCPDRTPGGRPMTEAEWLAATDPSQMLEFLADRLDERGLMLFGAACCRRQWGLFTADCRQAIEAAELYADGKSSADQLRAARNAIERVEPSESLAWWIAWLATFDSPAALEYQAKFPLDVPRGNMLAALKGQLCERIYIGLKGLVPKPIIFTELAAHAILLRDVVGNPFRPVTLSPCWLTATVTSLARQIYESWDFSPMPILADALQDAGCDSADVLMHCRVPGPHVRGCWVVDWVLGKT
ncbi:MAG: hypothetical protein JWO38_4095 [Gemmataceae bacterium]|nr:hypothetical protein [Gemmataceae bacterium]